MVQWMTEDNDVLPFKDCKISQPEIQVFLLDHMGSDLSVVNAARVSFSKVKIDLDNSDRKLIQYQAEHNHWSPFSHTCLQFRIKAPIFVARQLAKHQVGLAWNEVSRRYVNNEPEFYTPDVWRGTAKNKKQGSSNEEININPALGGGPMMVDDYQQVLKAAKWAYEELLRKGVCPEQARMVLPQSLMTEWYWSGTLYAFARVCKLRMSLDAQAETRYVAEQIGERVKIDFPLSWKALTENE